MLLELAVGDAYGAGFEYVPDAIVRQYNTLSGYRQHQKHRDLVPGKYTDDTQMSLAIAELLVDKAAWTPQNLAQKFVDVFKRDPRKGYASGFYDFLLSVRDGSEFLRRIRPYSDKSGAAMRAGPLGILPTINQVKEYTAIQAAVTHNTSGGIASATAAALMSHYCIYGLGLKRDLPDFVKDNISGYLQFPVVGKVGSRGLDSVAAALTAICSENSVSSILRRCISFTGDVDTVAAIALAAASGSEEIKSDLPLVLVRGLENGTYGRDYIIRLDQQLQALKSVPRRDAS